MQMVNYIQSENKLCQSQYKGVITLLHKQGERNEIKNYRPIALFNNDYKIIAKALAEKLKPFYLKLSATTRKDLSLAEISTKESDFF